MPRTRLHVEALEPRNLLSSLAGALGFSSSSTALQAGPIHGNRGHEPLAPTGPDKPLVSCSVSEPVLWPPDHELMNVGLSVTVDPPTAEYRLSVYGNDNATSADAAAIATGALQLRADRRGNGSGRIYLIVARTTAADLDVCTVEVPHDHSPASLADVARQASDAANYFRQLQRAPADYQLLGQSSNPSYSVTDIFRTEGAIPNGLNNAGEVIIREPAFGAWLYSDGQYYYMGIGIEQDTFARSISNTGFVVGTFRTSLENGGDFLFVRGGQPMDIGAGGWGDIPSVDDYGEVAGSNNLRAFLYDGSVHDLGTLGGSTLAYALNDSAQVVGQSHTMAGAQHAFLATVDGMIDIGTLGGPTSIAVSINGAGQVAGNADLPDGSHHAFLYDNGQMIDLGTLGGRNSTAFRINAVGQVIGTADEADGTQHAFIYYQGRITDLGTLPGDRTSQPLAINAAGDVVGVSGSVHPFLFSDGQMTAVADLFPPGSGWLGSSATNINDAGQILGAGTDPQRRQACYLLTPHRDETPSRNLDSVAESTLSPELGWALSLVRKHEP